jgi:endoglucanase
MEDKTFVFLKFCLLFSAKLILLNVNAAKIGIFPLWISRMKLSFSPHMLLLLLAILVLHPKESSAFDLAEADSSKQLLVDSHGAIIRGDRTRKEIALVFTGDDFADGGKVIRRALKKHRVHASFFLTGNFYSNPSFEKLIFQLKKNGHYLGAHSDKHLLYADWTKRDSLLVSKEAFTKDLLDNYKHMLAFGIKEEDAPYFLPPYEWYNSTVAEWTKEIGFALVNFTPGTRSVADYTYPQMGDRYVSSTEIYRSILEYEQTDPYGLNGFILLIHIGTDPRRTDKFYYRLDNLLDELISRSYSFSTITNLLK